MPGGIFDVMGGSMIKGQGRPSKTGHVTLIHLIYLISTYASEKSGVTMSKVKGVASKMIAETSVYSPTVGVGVLDDPSVGQRTRYK